MAYTPKSIPTTANEFEIVGAAANTNGIATYRDWLSDFAMYDTKEIPPTIPVLELEFENPKTGATYMQSIANIGDVVIIGGKSGSTKSYLSQAIAAGMGYHGDSLNFSVYQCKQDECVAYIDTEMSLQQASFRRRKMKTRQGSIYADNLIKKETVKNDKVLYLTMRNTSLEERYECLNDIVPLMRNKYGKIVKAIFLDGVLDMVNSSRNEEEAKNFADILMRLCDTYQIVIFAVIHISEKSQLEGDTMGHIGAYLRRKTSAQMHVFYDKKAECYRVDFVKLREAPHKTPEICFTFGENGQLEKISPEDAPKRSNRSDELREIAAGVYSKEGTEGKKHGDIKKEMMSVGIKEAKANALIQEMKNCGVLEHRDKLYYLSKPPITITIQDIANGNEEF